jgi:hypothetical protein
MAMSILKELRQYRKTLRDLKAENGEEKRHYKREFGKNSSITYYMDGMANGKTAALMQIDYFIARLEMEEEYGNA